MALNPRLLRAAANLALQPPPSFDQDLDVAPSVFTQAKSDSQGRKFPQAIAHRGYKDAFPENTMGAFRGAVEVGAHAIETDLHLSKDGVVVLSHDANLKRCFGHEDKIIDCDWSYLETLQTLQEPKQGLPRLKDLLEYLATPGLENIWVLLDIKVDNDADDMMRLIAKTISEVSPTRPWNQRILLGCWAATYIPFCAKHLPNFPITHIGSSLAYARQFFLVPNASFNLFQHIVRGPAGRKFQRQSQAQNRAVFVWTVNATRWMRWAIRRGVDGVVTDDPKTYLAVCRDYDAKAAPEAFTLEDTMIWLIVQLLSLAFAVLFWLNCHVFSVFGKSRRHALVKKPVAGKPI